MLDKCQRRRNRGGQQMMRAKQFMCAEWEFIQT